MRNLKRALSLALASVMLLGMMVVGTSAASYPDIDENDNVEAIEVLNAVKVMIGDRGNFRPDAAVNRHEMATIMAKLVLGVETADNYVGTHPFTDVFPWADKYVAACYENGLVAGTSATTFGGNQPLTAVQAAAMMLRALGYKDLSKGATDWRAPVTAMANQIRLFSGVASNPSEQLNRNQVAQLALNTLKSPMVNLKDNTISWTDGEGQIVITGGSREYLVLSSREAYARAINRVESSGDSASGINGYTVELGEHLYNGKLKLNDVTDVFGRPARRWEYDGKVIGEYAKEELLVKKYVDKVTGKDLYDLLGSDILTGSNKYDLNVHVDGVDDPKIVDEVKKDTNRNTSIVFCAEDLNRDNKAAVGATGTGVQTEVYVDHETDDIYVAIINTYLAIADKDYDTKKEETPLSVYGVKVAPTSKEYVKLQDNDVTIKLGVEDFDLVKDMSKDDSFLVTIADQSIQTIVPAEVISAASISAFKRDDHVVSGGTQYNYTTTATFDANSLKVYTGDGKENLKDRTYDIYLDAYGNLIGLKEIEAKKNYVFLAGLDRNSSNMVNRIADANAIFLDGTSDTIRINMNKSEWNDADTFDNANINGGALLNTWCTYTKNGDIYTVKEVRSTGNSLTQASGNVPSTTDNKTTNTSGLAQFHQFLENDRSDVDAKGNKVDSKEFNIDLKRLRLDGGGASSSSFRYVYGDSDSVYLTAELGKLRDDRDETGTKSSYGIIKEAATVSTGIIDTSITVWNSTGAMATANEDNSVKKDVTDPARVAKGVYTLYDKDGTVIAVMAVGEGSAAKDLVYVHTDRLDLESDNDTSTRAANDGLWTWTRRAIRDGQEVTLTEVGDEAEYINEEDMLQYHWYEIRTDGSGNVIRAREAENALGLVTSKNDANIGKDAFVKDYEIINDIVELDGVDTVLYQTAGGPNASQDNGYGKTAKQILVVKGNNTLAVNTVEGSGIHFRNDVNVVLQYWNRNTKEIDIMAGEGVNDLKDMVDIVNDITEAKEQRWYNGVQKTYYVSALIENGLATDIVIFDSYNTYSVNRPDVGNGDVTIKFNYADYPITRYDFTVNGSDPLVREDFEQANGVWSLKVDTNDVVDIVMKTATSETFGTQGKTYIVSERNTDGNRLTGTVRSQGYSVRIVPTVKGTYKLLDTFRPDTTQYFDVTVGANVTVTVTASGKSYTNTTVSLAEDTAITVKANEGYTAYVDGVKVNATGKYTVTDDMVITAKKDAPVGEPITITKEAVNDVTKNRMYVLSFDDIDTVLTTVTAGQRIILDPVEALEIKPGNGATIQADGSYIVDDDVDEIVISVKNGWSYNSRRDEWSASIDGNIEFAENYTPKAAAKFSNMARAITTDFDWLDDAKKDTEHIYTVTIDGIKWVGQATENNLTHKVSFSLKLDKTTGTAEQAAAAWAKAYGSEEGYPFDVTITEKNPTEPTEYKTNAVINDDASWTVRYMSDTNKQPTNDEIAKLIGEKVTVKKVTGSGDTRKVVIIPEGETEADPAADVHLVRVIPLWYNGKTLVGYADLNGVTKIGGNFDPKAVICYAVDEETKTATGAQTVNSDGTISADFAGVYNDTANKAGYLFDAVEVDISDTSLEVYLHTETEDVGLNSATKYIAADANLLVIGAGNAAITPGYRALTVKIKSAAPAETEYYSVSDRAYNKDERHSYGEILIADLPADENGKVTLKETLGLYRIEVGDLEPTYQVKTQEFEVVVPDRNRVYTTTTPTSPSATAGQDIFTPHLSPNKPGKYVVASSTSNDLSQLDTKDGKAADYVIKLTPAYKITNKMAGTGVVAGEKVYSQINSVSEIADGYYVAEGVKVYVKTVSPNTILSSGIDGVTLESALGADNKPILPSQTIEAQYYFEMPAADLTLDGDSFVVEQSLATDGAGLNLEPNKGTPKMSDVVTITSVGAVPSVEDITWYFNGRKLTLAEAGKVGKYFEVEVEPTATDDQYTMTVSFIENETLSETLTYEWVLEVGELSLKGSVTLDHTT